MPLNYCTRIETLEATAKISGGDRLLFLGSCFADTIGERMAERKFNACVNPFGTLYNPLSVAQAYSRLRQPTPFSTDNLFPHDGLYHSFMHHSCFSAPTAESCLATINNSLNQAAQHLIDTKWLFITFGTAFVYRLLDNQVVANCHKLPPTNFTRDLLTVDAITDAWTPLIAAAKQPLRFIFTVSPIRHLNDGAHRNNLSKATLLLAVDELCKLFPDKASYFPAYELLLDELRDYRFYDDDLLHPSKLAANYIFERFCETHLDNNAKELLIDTSALLKDLNHRVLNKYSDSYKHFLTQTMLKIKRLKAKYPYICISQEEKRITDCINELE
jgi:hypothetical protein